ncbi:hypothetical protein CN190_21165 [Sinorhizobium meliloti]|nr:hypothetical protein CN190_21165 [Sinorhizobium meliloti]
MFAWTKVLTQGAGAQPTVSVGTLAIFAGVRPGDGHLICFVTKTSCRCDLVPLGRERAPVRGWGFVSPDVALWR